MPNSQDMHVERVCRRYNASEGTRTAPSIARAERLLTVAEVAQMIGYSPKWVREHAESATHRARLKPALPGCQPFGRGWRFRAEDVEAFLDGQRDGESR